MDSRILLLQAENNNDKSYIIGNGSTYPPSDIVSYNKGILPLHCSIKFVRNWGWVINEINDSPNGTYICLGESFVN